MDTCPAPTTAVGVTVPGVLVAVLVGLGVSVGTVVAVLVGLGVTVGVLVTVLDGLGVAVDAPSVAAGVSVTIISLVVGVGLMVAAAVMLGVELMVAVAVTVGVLV